MRVWVDVFDASGNRLGAGPVLTVQQASFNRRLDGAGTFRLRCPGTDTRALTLLQNERRVQVWVEDVSGKRLAGEGIIRKRQIQEASGGVSLRVDGPDIMDELKRKTVSLARIYNQQTVSTVCSSLIGLVSGWSVSVDASIASDVIDARFDGVSVLKALQEIVERYGYHLRLSNTASKTIEIDTFGDSNGLRIHRIETITTETLTNDSLLMVQSLNQDTDSESLCNWLIPLGAGEGVAALTLEKSTRTSPYTIQTTTGPDGTTLYYLADSTSISANGQIEKVGQFKEVAPLSNSEADIINAANALYDAAVEYLTRHKDYQVVYAVSVKNVRDTILPGDKIHVNYVAQIETPTGVEDYLNIRDDFWVLDADESVSLGQSGVKLKISNVDRQEESVAKTVLNAIDQIQIRNLKPSISSSTRTYVYYEDMDSTHNVTIPIEFTDATLTAQRVRLRVQTRPLRANVEASAAGGDHRHRMFATTATNGVFPTSPTTLPYRVFNALESDLSSQASLVLLNAGNLDLYTDGASGAHTHDMEYGIYDDSGAGSTPSGITVYVNGENKTNDLFGSSTIAPSGGNIDELADAGELTNLLTGASGGLRQVHDIEIRCSGGKGRVQVTVEVFEVTQAIKLG